MRRPRRLSGGWITAQSWRHWTARALTLQLQRALHCKRAARLSKAALSIRRQCVRTRTNGTTIMRVRSNLLLQLKHLPWILHSQLRINKPSTQLSMSMLQSRRQQHSRPLRHQLWSSECERSQRRRTGSSKTLFRYSRNSSQVRLVHMNHFQ